MLNIKNYENKIKEICNKLHIKKLALFGSATTDEFSPKSDIDILVEFDIQRNKNLFNAYFALKEELENLFQRSVDIVVEHSIKNPYLKQTINSTRKTVYAG
ncbi:MAG: nucleotidyltransferase domain-containing protein [Candidatus Omnitrophica bacterium]|nr:nucleotidyltransferase domain-containing protein [Candidatus Omnitrophota bacterium]MCF7894184.1 nucleotidyltransferase domain-containing protein [Candidatus Omnitrophota bacterium]